MNGFALGLGLKRRIRATRKWAISSYLRAAFSPQATVKFPAFVIADDEFPVNLFI